jgi:hypothetical protein
MKQGWSLSDAPEINEKAKANHAKPKMASQNALAKAKTASAKSTRMCFSADC